MGIDLGVDAPTPPTAQQLADARTALRINGAETTGAKLRRLARAARLSNPSVNLPLKAPPAWAVRTAYTRGKVVANGGNWYVCIVAGTSAASGGPASVNTGALVTDNTAFWSWIGTAAISADDAQAPALTTSTSSPPAAGLTNFILPAAHPECFEARGCTPVNSGNDWLLNVLQVNASTIETGKGCSVAFETDALVFAILLRTAEVGVVRFVIDGRYYSPAATDVLGANTYFVFDFSGKGLRKRRRIEVRHQQTMTTASLFTFKGVVVGPADGVWKPADPDAVTVAWIDNSLADGASYGPFLPGSTVPQRVADGLGWSHVHNLSKGGTGLFATGSGTGSPFYTYGARIAQALSLNPDVVVFGDVINDVVGSVTPENITAQTLANFQAVRAASTAIIIVNGCQPINNAGVAAAEAAVLAAVTQFADERTFFLPLYNAGGLPVVAGSWNNSSNTSAVNSVYTVAPDGVHPQETGVAILAEHKINVIARDVLPLIP